MSKIRIDLLGGQASYRCGCGRTVRVPFAELVPDSTDYCGCGRVKVGFSPEDVAEYRKLAGLPELDKQTPG